jgi:hypothetical protein
MNKILLQHQRTLAHYLAKYPEQLDRINAILNIANLGYIPHHLRSALIDIVNYTLALSFKTDGIKPIKFGDPTPKPPKDRVIYREKIIKVPVEVIKEVVVKEKPTLPPRIPVLTEIIEIPKEDPPSPIPPDRNDLQREAVSVPPKAIPKPKPRIKKPKPPIDQPYHNRSALEELVTPLQQSVSKQFRGGGWGNDGVKNIRLGAGQSLPEGFKPGMLVKKRPELPSAK